MSYSEAMRNAIGKAINKSYWEFLITKYVNVYFLKLKDLLSRLIITLILTVLEALYYIYPIHKHIPVLSPLFECR